MKQLLTRVLFCTTLTCMVLALAPAGALAAQELTTIHHADGSRTEVHTDESGTYVRYFNQQGDLFGSEANHESHQENVERHADEGDRVERH